MSSQGKGASAEPSRTEALTSVAAALPIASAVPLGPPSRALAHALGGAIGLPIGLGIVMPPHGLLLGIGGALALASIAVGTTRTVIRLRRFATENNVAIGALGRGDLAGAHEVFARWARCSQPWISGIARHNLGWTLMLEGRLEEACAVLVDAAEHHEPALRRSALLPTTRIDIALCHALLGDLEAADTWRQQAELPVKAPPLPTFPGMLALVRAVIACRQGRASEGMVALAHAWAEHEPTMTGETLRMMRVVRAFACAAADGPRHQGTVERVLGDLRPRYRHEFTYLGRAWPEMATFLAAHQLAD